MNGPSSEAPPLLSALPGETRSGRRGDGLIVFSAACFSTMPIFATWAYASGVGVLPLLAWRFLLSAGLLWGILAFTVRPPAVSAARLGGFLGMGALYVVMSQIYFQALRLAPVSTLTLLFYTYPALVTILAAVLLKEPLTRLKIGALALALGGCVLVLRPRDLGDWRGAALALAASALYSGFMLIGTRLMRGVSPFLATAWIMSVAAAVFVVAALLREEMGPPRGLAAWGAITGIALVATVMSDVSFFSGLPRTGASRAAILSTVEPLFTLTLSALLLGESIPPVRFLGGVLILGSVVLIHREQAP